MPEQKNRLLEQIKDLIPINKLPTNLQARLLDQARVMEVNKSRFLFKQGDQDNYSYFLLEGKIELLVGKQGGDIIKGGSDRARYALAQIQPRQFSARARTKARVLIIERNSLDQLLVLADQSDRDAPSAAARHMGIDSIHAAPDADWMTNLLQSRLFSRMPMANIQQLFGRLEPMEYEAGAVVIRQGDPGDYYYIISEGRCAVSRKPSARSNDVKIAELGIGDSFGEEALVSNSKRNATITMQSAGVVMRLGKDDFVELIKTPILQALSYKEAMALIGQGGQWLDVRFPDEYRDGAIAGSVNIPLHSLRLESARLDEAKRYVLCCDTAKRSSAGAFLLAERGFEVAYLEGGLLNNPEAIGAGAPTPKPPAPKVAKSAPRPAPKAVEAAPRPAAEAAEVDAGVRVEILNAELETNQMRMRVAREQAGKDVDQKKELEALQRKLGEARTKLERQKKEAEAEAKKKAGEEAQRLKALKAEAEKKMQQKKRQLESIQNKNAKEQARLQKATEAAQKKAQKEKGKLERQAAAVTQKIAEAERLQSEIEVSKQSLEQEAEQKRGENKQHQQALHEKAKARLAEARRKLDEEHARNAEEFAALKQEKAAVEASKQLLEQEAEQKRRENEQQQQDLQQKAKARLAEARRKLDEEYARNVEKFEALKQEKATVEAARLAAREEAQKIVSEYKLQHDQTWAEEEARLKAERRKLEQEAKKIQRTMTQIQKIKLEAELAKQEAETEARRLREKQMDEIGSEAERERLGSEIRAAREKVAEAQQEIEDALRREKQAASARQENEADLSRKKQEQEALVARIKTDLADFEDKQQEEAVTIMKILIQADQMRRISTSASPFQGKAPPSPPDPPP